VKWTMEMPDNPARAALVAIQASGLAGALPTLDWGDGPIELRLRGVRRSRVPQSLQFEAAP
jgi:hypothetical protein